MFFWGASCVYNVPAISSHTPILKVVSYGLGCSLCQDFEGPSSILLTLDMSAQGCDYIAAASVLNPAKLLARASQQVQYLTACPAK